MAAYTPITTCAKNVVCLIGNVRRQRVVRVSPRSSCYFYTGFKKDSRLSCFSTNAKSRGFQEFQSEPGCHSLTFKGPTRSRNTSVSVSLGHEKMSPRLLWSRQAQVSRVKYDVGPFSWSQGSVTGALFMGLVVCFCTSRPSYAEGSETRESSTSGNSNNKKMLTNYFVIGIPGDGRCLFRSVAHGACIRLGNSAPDENAQRKLADELRARVADEFIKRREETEWFIEGDFDEYISQMRKPHVWGGEPELLMASHVLQMPITVYMHDKDSGGLISIAEYGQEYGKDDPIRVLYHGCGHYDALHFPGAGGVRPRL